MFEVFAYNEKNDIIEKLELDAKSIKKASWIRIVDPNPEKLKMLSERTGIPQEELQESLEEEERPKVSAGKFLEIIYRAPYTIDSELETLPVYFYMFEDKVITIEKKPLKGISDLSKKMSQNKSKFLFKKGEAHFIYHIMDLINDDFLSKIDKIASKIDLYENFSRKELTIKDIEKVYEQSVTLSFFNQALIANVEVLNTLKKGYFKLIKSKDKTLFEELYYNVLQILDTEKIQREAVTNLINVHSIITSTRLNNFMKKLTTIALIVAIPTLFSSIYGMNFLHIPLYNHPYGFYIITGMMMLITLFSVYMAKEKKWL